MDGKGDFNFFHFNNKIAGTGIADELKIIVDTITVNIAVCVCNIKHKGRFDCNVFTIFKCSVKLY